MTALEIRILEVATWILKVNPQFEHNYFRSEQIRPVTKVRVARQFSLASLDAVVRVATKRHAALRTMSVPLLTLEEALSLGKLVWTCPSDSTLDGGAEFYSQGLVDIWEIPAWDTWVSLGNLEFSEFGAYENCIISWIPESVYNLFYSGKAVGLEDNLDLVTQIPSNSMLVSSATVPARLDFVEVVDREEIERRLEQINKQVMVENDIIDSPRAVAQVPAGLSLWGKIKQLFL